MRWTLPLAALVACADTTEPISTNGAAIPWTGSMATWGTALASGDFDGDGDGDLAIGHAGASGGAGFVEVQMYEGGVLDSAFTIGAPFSPTLTPGAFGYALVAGQLDADPADELVISMPFATVDGAASSGAVMRVSDVTFDGFDWDVDLADGPHTAEPGLRYGMALTIGDFDGDGLGQLVVGAPGAYGTEGAVFATFGGTTQIFYEWTGGLGVPEPGEQFGAALAAGDLDGDGDDELAIGVPGESAGGKIDRGAVVLVEHDGRTLSGFALQDGREAGDAFGTSVAFNDQGVLGIASPGGFGDKGFVTAMAWNPVVGGLTFTGGFRGNVTGDRLGERALHVSTVGCTWAMWASASVGPNGDGAIEGMLGQWMTPVLLEVDLLAGDDRFGAAITEIDGDLAATALFHEVIFPKTAECLDFGQPDPYCNGGLGDPGCLY